MCYFCVLFLTEINQEMIEDIKKACQVMNEGGVILYPTDTVWGIGCDATNEEAVRRVYEIKKRADSKAMLVLVDSPVKVDFYVQDVPSVAWDLIEMTTKPLTIIYDGARNLAPNLIAADGSVGIRVTSEEFSKQLCFRFRKAIVSTSANISGQPAPPKSKIPKLSKSSVGVMPYFSMHSLTSFAVSELCIATGALYFAASLPTPSISSFSQVYSAWKPSIKLIRGSTLLYFR